MDVLEGKRESHQEYVYGLQTTVGINMAREAYPIRSVRDDRYKLIWNLAPANRFTNNITEADSVDFFESWRALGETDEMVKRLVREYQVRPEFEFYDLDTDPEELVNVVHKPEHSDRIAQLFTELKKWMSEQGDEGIAAELEAPEHQVRPRPLSVTSQQ
jgi:uncharacterized sulfatase